MKTTNFNTLVKGAFLIGLSVLVFSFSASAKKTRFLSSSVTFQTLILNMAGQKIN